MSTIKSYFYILVLIGIIFTQVHAQRENQERTDSKRFGKLTPVNSNFTAQGNASFEKAVKSWNKHNWSDSKRQLERHLQNYPDDPWNGEAKLILAEVHAAEKDLAASKRLLTDVNEQYPKTAIARKARLKLAHISARERDFKGARKWITSVLGDNGATLHQKTLGKSYLRWLIRIQNSGLDHNTSPLAEIMSNWHAYQEIGMNKDAEPSGQCEANYNSTKGGVMEQSQSAAVNTLSYGRKGMPILFINPVNLNVIVSDIPIWYTPGRGPGIAISVTYNSEDPQDLNDYSGSIQYYPFGNKWSFNYGAFYQVNPDNSVTLCMPDGRRDIFTPTGGGGYEAESEVYNTLTSTQIGTEQHFMLQLKRSKLKYHFNDPISRKLTAIEDRYGNIIQINYDGNHNIQSIADANGRLTLFETNSDGLVTRVTIPDGRSASFTYNDAGFMTGTTDMGGNEFFYTYDEYPLSLPDIGSVTTTELSSVTGCCGYQLYLDYEQTFVEDTEQTYAVTVNLPNGTNLKYHWQGMDPNRTEVTHPGGQIVTYKIDLEHERISSITYPENSEMVYGYDQLENRNSFTLGNVQQRLTYDERGNITTYIDSRGKSTSFTYDANDNLISITDPMNRITTLTYNNHHSVTSITTPAGTQRFTYNNLGDMTSSTDANGNQTTYSYDGAGYLVGIQPPTGSPITITHDDAGRTQSFTGSGITLNYSYDGLDQITRIDLPNGALAEYTYALRSLVQEVDYGGRVTNYSYNPMNQISQIDGPDGVIHYAYDSGGNITSVDVNGKVTSYEYDHLNRLTRATNPDGTSRSYQYDAANRLIKKINENNETINISWDGFLLAGVNYSTGRSVQLGYDNAGDLISLTDATGTTRYEYDAAGRLTKINGPANNDDVVYSYDAVGNRTGVSVAGIQSNYAFNAINQLTELTANAISLDYSYNADNRLQKIEYGNGIYSDFSYDAVQRLTARINSTSGGEQFSEFHYRYTKKFLIERIADQSDHETTYQYDEAFQLIQEYKKNASGRTIRDYEFSYDNNGNRTRLSKNGVVNTYDTNENDQVTAVSETDIRVTGVVHGQQIQGVSIQGIAANIDSIESNDVYFTARDVPIDNGESSVQLSAQIDKTYVNIDRTGQFTGTASQNPGNVVDVRLSTDVSGIPPSQVQTVNIVRDQVAYSYDAVGRLQQEDRNGEITTFHYNSDGSLAGVDLPGGKKITYATDARKRRTARFENGVKTHSWVYGTGLLPLAEYDGNGNLLTVFIYGNSQVPAAMVRQGQTYYILKDHLGSPRQIVDASGSVVKEMDYDAFGNQTRDSNPDFQIPIGFAGGMTDPDHELIRFGARDYMPSSGKWTARDPIFFAGGFNLYRYAENNPVINTDRSGLQCGANPATNNSDVIEGEIRRVTIDDLSTPSLIMAEQFEGVDVSAIEYVNIIKGENDSTIFIYLDYFHREIWRETIRKIELPNPIPYVIGGSA